MAQGPPFDPLSCRPQQRPFVTAGYNKKKREPTDEPKSVSSFFLNNKKLLPQRVLTPQKPSYIRLFRASEIIPTLLYHSLLDAALFEVVFLQRLFAHPLFFSLPSVHPRICSMILIPTTSPNLTGTAFPICNPNCRLFKISVDLRNL